jgi:hypothetical protein
MTKLWRLVVGILLGTMLGSVAFGADRDPRRLGLEIVKRLVARRTSSQIHATDFQGTNIGCIILPRRELRRSRYPGHAMLCEEASAGEVLGAVLSKSGKQLCDITGSYSGDFCYAINICGYDETLCTQ